MTVGELRQILADADDRAGVGIAETRDNYGFECRIHTAYKNMETGDVVIIAGRRNGNVQNICKPKEVIDKRERCFG